VASLGCGRPSAPLFKPLRAAQTGITFANSISTTDSLNALTDPYVYNGAGVGVGDIDNDGLVDIFFAGNLVSSRLYLNKGNMRFEDITQAAGVTTHRWATGVSMVDINNDGLLDIYVSVSGPEWSAPAERANLLFINNGDRTFTEAAATYGIADDGFTTQAAFLDYDSDGDLDLFLLNNSPKDFARSGIVLQPAAGPRAKTPDSYNRLYRNNGDGSFTNVSDQAGILQEIGYGLGVAVADINDDGQPDIYVSNDITPNDVLYVNNGDGTFTDKAAQWLRHTSFAGMGVDIADFNNDGRPDILQADMMPPALPARKRMSGYMSYADVLDLHHRGFRVDYEVNTLQLHAGFTSGGDVVFSEIARMAGVAYTDWSWSVLFADVDNDGWKDIFVTNGYPKALNDLDYKVNLFRAQRTGNTRRAMELLRNLRSYEVPNCLFLNEADLTFSDRSAASGMDQAGFSYGAAYADLNNDGKLDLVVNNMDAPASIYENVRPARDHHYLRIDLRGDAPNVRGIGSTIAIVAGGRKQYVYQSPYRGYMSTVDDRPHFGLGAAVRVDTLEVTWPDGRSQMLTDLDVDRTLTLKQGEATEGNRATRAPSPGPRALFQPSHSLHYRDPTSSPVDFAVQPLLPDQPSREGPPLAVGDVNGDGLEDVFIGGGDEVPGKLLLQRQDGGFAESVRDQPWAADQAYTDWGARFFDANGDGKLDLYVASGGYHASPISSLLQDRLYVNQGGGRFVRDSAALPPMLTSTAAIAVGDFTGDGRPDLFVGGRLVPRNYPLPARSYLLRNDGGRFTDVTDSVAPELARPMGMITAAVWVDFDGDGRLDLVTAGLWMPLRFFRNDGRRLHDVGGSMKLPPLRGWWYSLAAGDFNHDGRVDLVAGNLGLNHTYTASADGPFGVYAADFTGHQTTDIVLTQRQQGREYPTAGVSALVAAIYTLGVKFPTADAFASATVDQLLTPGQRRAALHYEVDTFASLYLENKGGTFTPVPLPNLAQIAPIRGIIAHDVDGDGNIDLIVAGNLHDTEPNTAPADAGNGLWLRGDGLGRFTPVPSIESGFLAPGYVTGLALIKTPAGHAVLVASHGDSLQAFTMRTR
jgi:hypothetical protein